jgi:hypothetical protein
MASGRKVDKLATDRNTAPYPKTSVNGGTQADSRPGF